MLSRSFLSDVSSYRAKKHVADVIDPAKFALPGTAMRRARDVRCQDQVCGIGQPLTGSSRSGDRPRTRAMRRSSLGATRAIPLATVGPNAASAQHVAVLIGLDTLVRGQRSVGDLLNV